MEFQNVLKYVPMIRRCQLITKLDVHLLHRVFLVITFAAITVGRSASLVPNYSRGKASALRIIELNKLKSKIDPGDPSGITLVRMNHGFYHSYC